MRAVGHGLEPERRVLPAALLELHPGRGDAVPELRVAGGRDVAVEAVAELADRGAVRAVGGAHLPGARRVGDHAEAEGAVADGGRRGRPLGAGAQPGGVVVRDPVLPRAAERGAGELVGEQRVTPVRGGDPPGRERAHPAEGRGRRAVAHRGTGDPRGHAELGEAAPVEPGGGDRRPARGRASRQHHGPTDGDRAEGRGDRGPGVRGGGHAGARAARRVAAPGSWRSAAARPTRPPGRRRPGSRSWPPRARVRARRARPRARGGVVYREPASKIPVVAV